MSTWTIVGDIVYDAVDDSSNRIGWTLCFDRRGYEMSIGNLTIFVPAYLMDGTRVRIDLDALIAGNIEQCASADNSDDIKKSTRAIQRGPKC